jgi:hypothetical protein
MVFVLCLDRGVKLTVHRYLKSEPISCRYQRQVVNCNYFRRLTEANKNSIIEKLNLSLQIYKEVEKKIAEANKNKSKEFNQLTPLT